MTGKRPESVLSSVINGKSLPIRLPACHRKLVRAAMLVFDLQRTHMLRYLYRGQSPVKHDMYACLEIDDSPGSSPAPHGGRRCSAFVWNSSSHPIIVGQEENLPWVCYVWPCSAHLKWCMTAAASPLPCARRRPCCSTWQWRGACILGASWRRCCGPTVSPPMRARTCATPLPCCAACSPIPTPRLPSTATCSLSMS